MSSVQTVLDIRNTLRSLGGHRRSNVCESIDDFSSLLNFYENFYLLKENNARLLSKSAHKE